MPLLYSVAKGLLVALVYLVDKQEHRYRHLLNLVEKVHILLWILHHVGNVEQNICVLQSRLREGQHRLLELVVGFQHTRGIREHYLSIVLIDNTHDTVARGLRLECGNAYTLANKLIHQRRLAHIRIANYVYKTCFVHIF